MDKQGRSGEKDIGKQIQDILFNMMIQFHQLCQKHNLTYFMLGGTMLGAVRHGDFVPWDDDLDVGLPRKDYERLISLPRSELPENLEILSMEYSHSYPYNFAKIVEKNTTIVEDIGGKSYVMGVYIDVFPLDGMGNSMSQAKRRIAIAKLLRVCAIMCYTRKKSDSFWRNLLKSIIWIVGMTKWQKILNRTLKGKSFETSKFVGNFLGAWSEKEIMPREIFGTPTLYPFREKRFYGPEKFDDYLKRLYGDYMKLPPVDKRKSHHSFAYINTTLPFQEYLRGETKS